MDHKLATFIFSHMDGCLSVHRIKGASMFSFTRAFQNLLFLTSTVVFLFGVQPSFAKDSGGYVGGSIGITSIDLCGDLFAVGATSCDDEDTGLKVFGGYKFNPNFAVEGGWADFGEISASVGTATVTAESDALFISALGAIPLGKRASIFGKIGLFFWDATIAGTGIAPISDDGSDIMFGAGFGFDFTSQFAMRAEWEVYDLDGDDISMLSVGVQFTF
jgi:OOP family OmpA-OmpF porin